MVVDDVGRAHAPLRRPTAPQGQELRGAEEAGALVLPHAEFFCCGPADMSVHWGDVVMPTSRMG